MMKLTKQFETGNAIYFECLFRNHLGLPVDPTSPEWEIQNKNYGQIAVGSLTKRKTGIFYFFWVPNLEGVYYVVFKGMIDGKPAYIRKEFKVTSTKLK